MINRYLFLFLLLFITSLVTAQKQNFWSATLFIGLNSPLVNDGDTTQNVIYQDEMGLPQPGTASTTGALLVPPLSLDLAFNFNPRFALGLNAIYQAHTEKTVIRSSNSTFVSESQKTQQTLLFFAEANYIWLSNAPFRLSSGGGLGYGFSTLETTSGQNTTSFCFDFRPLTVRYELCCGWSILAEGRYTSSPTGLRKTAGYNIGLGVAYVFNQ